MHAASAIDDETPVVNFAGPLRLTLFICDESESSRRAVAQLRELCGDNFDDCELEVIDILEFPERAEQAKILATPTLIKELPPPIRRVIGDLTNKLKVLDSLAIVQREV